jgi:predicted CoA-binding protein
MPIHSRRTIDDFLAQKRIAFAGVSRNSKDFSRQLFAELVRRGYDLIPVNPNTAEIDGRTCVDRIAAIAPAPEGALLLTTPKVTEELVAECAAAGVRRVWMFRAGGKGSVSPIAVAFCQENGIQVIAGECPFMFLPETQWIHRFHGALKKITGSYPAAC